MNEPFTSSELDTVAPRALRHVPSGERIGSIEWPTVGLIVACTLFILAMAFLSMSLPIVLVVFALAPAIALHSSLQHEVLHGHPTRLRWLNEALVFIPFGLFVPFQRFRDLHLQHHVDERLTDPYDDPESNYQDPERWRRLSGLHQRLLSLNNTLLGRMIIGPVIGLAVFLKADLVLAMQGDRDVLKAYGLHATALLPWLYLLYVHADVPLWAYGLAAYLALSLLKVRTFLEHRAHETVSARTAIVEDRGVFAWLFLNNNLHLVHHRHPRAPWYRLPALYQARREQFRAGNRGYVYSGYRAVFSAYLFRQKDPVAHPLPIRQAVAVQSTGESHDDITHRGELGHRGGVHGGMESKAGQSPVSRRF